MSTPLDTRDGNGEQPDTGHSEHESAGHELPQRARSAGVIAWCSFLAAGVATTVVFAFFDPATVPAGDVPGWWQSRRAVYAVGFFFFWCVAALSAALTLYMLRTEHHDAPDRH